MTLKSLGRAAVGVLALSLIVQAEPADSVTAAAKKLADAPCYSWKTTIEAGANAQYRPGPQEGKTIKGGATWLSLSLRDNKIEIVTKAGKTAVKTDDGWQSTAEAETAGGGGGGGGGGRGFNPGRMAARTAQNLKAPAVEAQDLALKATALSESDGAVSGNLTEAGAKEFLTRGGGRRGGNPPEVSNAKGTVKFWVKDGALAKYEYHVQGTVSFNGNDREVDRTTTVEISDVGTTKIELPDEAQKKLE